MEQKKHSKIAPLVVMVGGREGSGRTFVSEELASYIRENFVDLSVIHIDLRDIALAVSHILYNYKMKISDKERVLRVFTKGDWDMVIALTHTVLSELREKYSIIILSHWTQEKELYELRKLLPEYHFLTLGVATREVSTTEEERSANEVGYSEEDVYIFDEVIPNFVGQPLSRFFYHIHNFSTEIISRYWNGGPIYSWNKAIEVRR